MRLLVVRCLVFDVVKPETMARGNAGAICVLQADFQSDGGLSRLRFDLQRDFVFGGCFVGFGFRFCWSSFVRSGGQSVSRSVPNGYSRAGRRSMAMKLQREPSPQVSGSS